MYWQYSWHVLKLQRQARNFQNYFKIYRLYKALPKAQVTNSDSSIKVETIKVAQCNNNNNEFIQFNSKPVTNLSNIMVEDIKRNEVLQAENVEWRKIEVDTSKLGHYFLKLSKFRLTTLVVMTSMMGYAMAPNAFEITSFLSCAVGTGLVSSAANSVNQFLEVPFDAQMSRTKNRVLVQGYLMPYHAIGFATVTSTLGLAILYFGANPLTAILGASNLILYTSIYTPLKRISICNTWIGSIVGAIPPLMGWTASQGSLSGGALILGGILFAWQFPHFNALSWNLRPDYSRAGYRMMAVTNPDLCRKTAFRYTLGITAFSSLAPLFSLTHWCFGIFSLPLNLYFVYLGFKFYKESDSKNSRKLFRFSLLHLPILMALMLVTKNGLISSSITPDVSYLKAVISASEEKSNISKKKSNMSVETRSCSGLSGLTLGPTLHTQVLNPV